MVIFDYYQMEHPDYFTKTDTVINDAVFDAGLREKEGFEMDAIFIKTNLVKGITLWLT